MGWLDRLLGDTPTASGPERRGPAAPLDLDARTIGFAAARIDPGIRPDRRQQAANAKRSEEMWTAYEAVGEVGYVVDFFGNALRRCRVFPAGVDDPKDGRIPLEDCTWASDQLAADAAALLERVRSVEHGQGEVLSQMAVNLKVTGAGNLYAAPDDELGLEDWEVLSTSSLVWHRGRWCRKTDPTDRRPEPINGDQIWRFWQRHPRWPGLAYSEMTRILGTAENLQLLERAARNRARSRVAGAGLLWISNRYAFKVAKPTQGKDFFDDLQAHMTTPMKDEGAVSAFVPLQVDVDTDDVTKAAMHMTLDNPFTAEEEAREERLIRRIGQGMDAPPELATGFHDVKFANGLIIQQETYEAHVEPLALRVADILAVSVVRAGLLILGHPPDVVARVTNGVDPSDLIRRTDTTKDAKDAHAAIVISDKTYRERLGFTDDDAPDDVEYQRRADLKRPRARATDEAAVTAAAPATLFDDIDDAPAADTAGAAQLGGRLEALDVDLTARILGAAETATAAVIARAASRARQQVRRTEHAGAARGPARGILTRLAGAVLAVDDLVVEEDFTDLHDTWDTATAATYTSARAAVDQTTTGDVDERDPQDDIDAGWAVLLAGLTAATRAALTTPEGQDLTDPGGETDPGAVVQPGLIRQSISRAGGALGSTSDGGAVLVDGGIRPAGGIATGEHILDAATQAGLILTGWTWQVGAPARPFPPHHQLAGVTFTNPDDAALSNTAGEWPGNGHWYVGDHAGCRCTAQPNFEPVSSN